MTTLTRPTLFTPADVQREEAREGRLYELIDGELQEKRVGFESMFIAGRIVSFLNAFFYPHRGAAAAEVMIYCFNRPNHGRKPDVVYVELSRLPDRALPSGDLFIAPELVVEVLSQSNTVIELERKLDEYLKAGIRLVWIVTPEWRTIRAYRADGTTQLFHADDVIANEPTLPGFELKVNDIFQVTPNELNPQR